MIDDTVGSRAEEYTPPAGFDIFELKTRLSLLLFLLSFSHFHFSIARVVAVVVGTTGRVEADETRQGMA